MNIQNQNFQIAAVLWIAFYFPLFLRSNRAECWNEDLVVRFSMCCSGYYDDGCIPSLLKNVAIRQKRKEINNPIVTFTMVCNEHTHGKNRKLINSLCNMTKRACAIKNITASCKQIGPCYAYFNPHLFWKLTVCRIECELSSSRKVDLFCYQPHL